MVVVATQTGIGEHAYDCGTLSRVLEDIGKLGRPNKHVVVCCTVLPGYIATVATTLLEGCEDLKGRHQDLHQLVPAPFGLSIEFV